jgi:hypothetical protein
MSTRTRKHRAVEPTPSIERSGPAGTHRASRTSHVVLTALIGVALMVLIVLLGAQR